MKLNRRAAMAAIGATGLAAGPACADTSGGAFLHGVASGDPAMDGAVLWTRFTGSGNPTRGSTTILSWEVAEDPRFRAVVADGFGHTDHGRDHTLKAVVTRLKPGTEYWYRFTHRHSGTVSPVGRFKTLPETSSTEPVHLAVASCALWPGGLFTAYDAIARLDQCDAIVHLGDYTYEYGAAEGDYGMRDGLRLGRIPVPAHETVTLDDYRARLAQYRTDPMLQAAHARAAWIVTFDDHEIANDPWAEGAQNHQPETEGTYAARKAAALKAWYEWMPIREPAPGARLEQAVQRSFRFGRSAALHMLETRLIARSKQLEVEDIVSETGLDVARLNDPARTLLGAAQIGLLEGRVRAAVEDGVAWQVLGNQTIMARVASPDVDRALGREAVDAMIPASPEYRRRRSEAIRTLGRLGAPLNLDQWDGYPAERERLYAALKATGARTVVVSGDSHAHWANDLRDGAGDLRGVEFGVTAVSSPVSSISYSFRGADMTRIIPEQSPEVRFCEFETRGYLRLTLSPDYATGVLAGVSTVEQAAYEPVTVATFRSEALGRGQTQLSRID